jgi:Aspartyl protease/PDZ domain
MIRTSRAAFAFLVASALSAPVVAAAASPTEILAKVKEAAGGQKWDDVRSLHSKVHIATSGLEGEAEGWDDLLTGRGVSRYALGPLTGAEGFDGTTFWSQDPSGQAHPEEGGDEREGGMNEAYQRCLAYWYPERHPGEITALADTADGGITYHVLRIVPDGGRPFTMWIDPTTRRIVRTVEPGAMETRTTFYSDYREVNGLWFPFSVRSTNGEAAYDMNITLVSVEPNVELADSLFAMPGPPPPDFSLPDGKTSVTVPFDLLNNHMYVDVTLNGKGPFRVICDTGGGNVITPTVVKELGLTSQGALQGRGIGEKSEDVGLVKVESLALGDVVLRDQVFAVLPLEPFADVEGVEIRGLVGYEVFKRFVAEIDYEHRRITLTLPEAFHYAGTAAPIPFQFDGSHPQVEGSIDGIQGKFTLDTGSRASLTLLGPFSEKNDLMKKYAPKYRGVTGWGVGGPGRGAVARAGELKLGNVTVANPVTELSLQTKGAFTDPYQAGNVGAGVLKRFNVTFDYGHQQVYLEPNANNATPDSFDRSGMWVNRSSGGFEVVDVTEKGPAAQAGLAPGDRITAVNGKDAGTMTLPALRDRLRSEAPGTSIHLRVEAKGKTRDVTLVLRDLI